MKTIINYFFALFFAAAFLLACNNDTVEPSEQTIWVP